jgi:hypothetical protein
MKVCDRCRKEIDSSEESKLIGKQVELCTSCGEFILNHIKNYKPAKRGFFGV